MEDFFTQLIGDFDTPAAVFDKNWRVVYANKANDLFPEAGELINTDLFDLAELEPLLNSFGTASARIPSILNHGDVVTFFVCKQHYVAIVSHDKTLKTGLPYGLSGIDMFSSSYRNEVQNAMVALSYLEGVVDDDVEAIKKLDSIKRNCYSMLRNCLNVATVSRYELGQLQLNIKRQDICQVVSNIVSAASAVLPRSRITLDSPNTPIYCRIDLSLFERAFINLLSNSIKYSRDENSIAVTVEEEGAQVRITIKDSGAGIKAENLALVKKPYFSVVPADDGDLNPGLGLGLSIADFTISQFGGIMLITSEFGKGTTVIFTLPIDPETDKISGDYEHLEHFATSYVVNRFSPIYIGLCENCEMPYLHINDI